MTGSSHAHCAYSRTLNSPSLPLVPVPCDSSTHMAYPSRPPTGGAQGRVPLRRPTEERGGPNDEGDGGPGGGLFLCGVVCVCRLAAGIDWKAVSKERECACVWRLGSWHVQMVLVLHVCLPPTRRWRSEPFWGSLFLDKEVRRADRVAVMRNATRHNGE